jgi:hypothetical protein
MSGGPATRQTGHLRTGEAIVRDALASAGPEPFSCVRVAISSGAAIAASGPSSAPAGSSFLEQVNGEAEPFSVPVSLRAALSGVLAIRPAAIVAVPVSRPAPSSIA